MIDRDLHDLLSEFADGVDMAAVKASKRLIDIGLARDAGDILMRAELLSAAIKRAASRGGPRAKSSFDDSG